MRQILKLNVAFPTCKRYLDESRTRFQTEKKSESSLKILIKQNSVIKNIKKWIKNEAVEFLEITVTNIFKSDPHFLKKTVSFAFMKAL